MAELYGATVVTHTDHAAKKLLPWIDGLLDAGEQYFKTHGKPLYSSHMLDLSEEPIGGRAAGYAATIVASSEHLSAISTCQEPAVIQSVVT